MKGKIFVVATPIGNLQDFTFRAVETLKSVDFIAAEDTRRSKILCQHYKIEAKLVSFHAQSSPTKVETLLARLSNGESMALVSDAGTPCISDPGFRLISVAVRQGIEVIPIPGASSLTALLSAAGMPVDKFTFHGFLPHKKGRQTLLKNLLECKISQVFFESVHRFPRLLDELEAYLGLERKIVVGRELTKIHEEIFRGTVEEAQKSFSKENTRGEFVVLVAPENF
jgi:16S rRNA (cytidine1402-2'-O)-methyltransferase